MKTSSSHWAACSLHICKLRVKFLSPSGNCTSNVLDNPYKEDFERNALDKFEGQDVLGECEDFEAEEITSAAIYHEGDDGWLGEHLKIYLRSKCLKRSF